jgi:hypothetical protein
VHSRCLHSLLSPNKKGTEVIMGWMLDKVGANHIHNMSPATTLLDSLGRAEAALLDAIGELEASGLWHDHPTLVSLRAALDGNAEGEPS